MVIHRKLQPFNQIPSLFFRPTLKQGYELFSTHPHTTKIQNTTEKQSPCADLTFGPFRNYIGIKPLCKTQHNSYILESARGGSFVLHCGKLMLSPPAIAVRISLIVAW